MSEMSEMSKMISMSIEQQSEVMIEPTTDAARKIEA